jgi:hypothetical protein
MRAAGGGWGQTDAEPNVELSEKKKARAPIGARVSLCRLILVVEVDPR